MTRDSKRSISERNGSAASRSIRQFNRRARLLRLSLSKLSDLRKRCSEDMRVRVLLLNTYSHFKNSASPTQGQGELAPQPALPNVHENLQDAGMGFDTDEASARPPPAGEPPCSSAQALPPNPAEAEATSIWDSFSCDGRVYDPVAEGFEILAAPDFQGSLVDNLFTDMAELESAPVPNGGQPSPACTSQEMEADPQPENMHLADQTDSSLAGFEHLVELLNNLK